MLDFVNLTFENSVLTCKVCLIFFGEGYINIKLFL